MILLNMVAAYVEGRQMLGRSRKRWMEGIEEMPYKGDVRDEKHF